MVLTTGRIRVKAPIDEITVSLTQFECKVALHFVTIILS